MESPCALDGLIINLSADEECQAALMSIIPAGLKKKREVHRALQLCNQSKDLVTGRQLYAVIVKHGLDSSSLLADYLIRLFGSCALVQEASYVFQALPQRTVYTWHALISAYTKLGDGHSALKLYHGMLLDGIHPDKDVVSWCALISGYAEYGHSHLAIDMFKSMQGEGVKPDNVTFLWVLKACGSLEFLPDMPSMGMACKPSKYLSFCSMKKMTSHDVVSWGVIITGCVENGSCLAALKFYEKMAKEVTFPDKVTFLACLRACAYTCTIVEGRWTHRMIVMSGLESDIAICSSLVDMYSRCGCIVEACDVFEKCPFRDIAMWGSMIAGYARHGSRSHVEKCLRGLQHEGLEPNGELITSVLSMRNHTSPLDICRAYCEHLFKGGNSDVSVEHYSCIINILGRVGQLDEAAGLVHTMPISPNAISWTGLLTSCGTFGDHGLGYRCFDQTKNVDMEACSFTHSPRLVPNASLLGETPTY
ncbi:hypothetical protein GOP47_0020518 [Adiantum capillus-veneris]|uniref:Pentatricopeptide repeat-containing protein n=1 Tax=Adiantum capillus-veneris TaxID=13818 RepID=A0A9D4Z656_ADICA|nr:hypothetical protein GOP47_0020518 [Adiantum capillus-veneris]